MTSLPLGRPVQPSLFRPPITRVPGAEATPSRGDSLRDLAGRSRSWHRKAVDLPVPVTCALWLIAAASGAVGGWATAVLTHRVSCSGVVWHSAIAATIAAKATVSAPRATECKRKIIESSSDR